MTLPTFRAAGSTVIQSGTQSLSVPIPAGAVTGDLLLLTVASVGGSPQTPSGWTQISAPSSFDGSYYNVLYVYWRIAQAGDAGSNVTFTTTGGSTSYVGAVTAWANGQAVISSSTYNPGGTLAATTIPANAVNVSGNDRRTIVVYSFTDYSSLAALTVPAGMTARVNGDTTSGWNPRAKLVVADDANNPNTTRTATLSTTEDNRKAVTIVIGNRAPNPPSLLSPTNATALDLSAGATFDWAFSDPDPGDSQSSYALRRKVAGAGSYEYWNAATGSWTGSEVKNASTATEVTFGAGQWTNGVSYVWSVKTWDAADLAGTYASDQTVSGQEPPTVTVTAPIGVIVDNVQPTATWSVSSPSGAARTHYQVIVESGAFGTTPGSGTTVYDSGVIASSSISHGLPALDANVNFRIFVQVTETGDIISDWDYDDFIIELGKPAPPVITVAPDDTNAYNIVTVQGQVNLLTKNQASLETDTTGWAAGTSTTIARTTAQTYDGQAALRLTRDGTTGTASANTPSGASGIPVEGSKQYTALAHFRPNTTARAVRVLVSWYNSSGTLISTTTGNSVIEATGNWTKTTLTTVSPANAAFARVTTEVLNAAATEIHDVDGISFHPGTLTDWHRGGLFDGSSPFATLERSDDGGTTWVSVREADMLHFEDGAGQLITVQDHEAPLEQDTIQYRAYVKAEV